MPTAAAHRYRARFDRVLRHIERNLDDDLSVEALSGVAAFSKHHFHRQFAALFGLGLHRCVQRVRFFPDVPEHEAVTDVLLPLAG